MNSYPKSFHIDGYTFQADIWCPNCMAGWASECLYQNGYTNSDVESMAESNLAHSDIGWKAQRSESLLSFVADLLNHKNGWKIDVEDPYSYDSMDFPKIIFNDQIETEERCGNCNGIL